MEGDRADLIKAVWTEENHEITQTGYPTFEPEHLEYEPRLLIGPSSLTEMCQYIC